MMTSDSNKLTIQVGLQAHEDLLRLADEVNHDPKFDQLETLELDLNQVKFGDSSFLGALLKIEMSLAEKGVKLKLNNVHRNAQDVLRYTSLRQLLAPNNNEESPDH